MHEEDDGGGGGERSAGVGGKRDMGIAGAGAGGGRKEPERLFDNGLGVG